MPSVHQEEPFVEVIEIDKQMLMEKIVRLQKSHARKNEKLDFMEDHIQRLIREVQKKARSVVVYCVGHDKRPVRNMSQSQFVSRFNRRHVSTSAVKELS